MWTESRPHPKVTVYDNIIDSKRKDKLISALLAGQFHLTLNDSYEEINPDYVLCKRISGDGLKLCSDVSWNKATVQNHNIITQLSFKQIKKQLDRLAKKAEISIGKVDSLSVHVLTVADTLLSTKDEQAENKRVLIYMANTTWKFPWNGELILYEKMENSNDNILSVITYTPGRVVVIEGDVSYRINSPSASAPKYMVLAMLKYWKGKGNDNDSSSSSNSKNSEAHISYSKIDENVENVLDRVYL